MSTPSADAASRTGALEIDPVVRLDGVRSPGRLGFSGAFGMVLILALLDGAGLLDRLLPGLAGPSPLPWRALVGFLAVAPIVGLLAWMFRKVAWRTVTWRLDEDGVGRTISDGVATFLRWEDVEALRLDEDRVVLMGGHVRVSIPFKPADRDAILAAVESRLPAGFDLHTRAPAFGPVGDFLRVVAWSVLGTLVFVATVLGPGLIQDFGGHRIGWIGLPVLCVWMWVASRALRGSCRKVTDAMWIRRRIGPPGG